MALNLRGYPSGGNWGNVGENLVRLSVHWGNVGDELGGVGQRK